MHITLMSQVKNTGTNSCWCYFLFPVTAFKWMF